jgi:hypothetical protein
MTKPAFDIGSPSTPQHSPAIDGMPIGSDRLRRLALGFALVAGCLYAFDLLRQTQSGLTDGAGRPFGDDFVNYWCAAALAWQGRAAEIYDALAFHRFQQSVVGEQLGGFHYSYPPALLLLTAPLSLIPYVPALGVWLGASGAALFAALRSNLDRRDAALFLLASPAVLVNAIGGQNGMWSAALIGGGLIWLDRRPWLAGILFGLLIYKPHLGLLLPVALIAGRYWRAFAAAELTVVALVAASALIFGSGIWADYLAQADVLRRTVLEDGTGVWHRMVSVFVMARRFGGDITTAYAIQALAALAAAAAVALVWRRGAPAGPRNALLILATFLSTPYLQDYDMVAATLAVVWLSGEAARQGRERDLFWCAVPLLVLPLVTGVVGHITGLALGPLFIVPAAVLAFRLARA